MPSTESKIEAQLMKVLKTSLHLSLYSNASFTGELLLTQANNDTTRIKLAKAYNGTHLFRRKQALQGIPHTQKL